MVSDKRKEELAEISQLESYLKKKVDDEKESAQLFKTDNIEVKTDLNEEEVSIMARLQFLVKELDLKNFGFALDKFMQLRLSKGRKSRKEFIEAIKKDTPFNFGGANLGGFNNGLR